MSTVFTLDDIELPGDLEWIDEFDWSPVAAQTEVTLGGSLLVEESAQLAGRPITLRTGQAGSTLWGVVPRSTVLALQALANTPRDTPMTLTLPDERTFDVLFRHTELAVEARPQRHVWPPEDTDLYLLTLRLQVAE